MIDDQFEQPIRLLCFSNGSGLGTAKSGGTTRLIETAKRFIRDGIEIFVVTTPGARKLFDTENLSANYFIVQASVFSTVEHSNFGRVWSYIISTLHSILITSKYPTCSIVYATSDYFCDVIPAVFYKIFRSRTMFVVMIHHLCRHPKQRKGNRVLNLASYIGQRASFWLLSRFVDQVFVYATPEGEEIGRYFMERGVHRVMPVANGVSLSEIDKVSVGVKKYDACFVGGLRASKGIYDLIPIWTGVVARFPEAQLAVIGGGITRVENDLHSRLRSAGLENNITLLGALPKVPLYKAMKESRIFLSTSYEEGWGIAVCEALACGIPVVAFSLPAFRFLQNHIEEVPIGDHNSVVEKVIGLLCDTQDIEQHRKLGRSFVEQFDWDQITKNELVSFQEIL